MLRFFCQSYPWQRWTTPTPKYILPFSLLCNNIEKQYRALNLSQLASPHSFLRVSYLTFKELLWSIKLDISEAHDTFTYSVTIRCTLKVVESEWTNGSIPYLLLLIRQTLVFRWDSRPSTSGLVLVFKYVPKCLCLPRESVVNK